MFNESLVGEDACLQFKKIADYYIITLLGFIGFVLNLLCSIAMIKSGIYKTSDSIMFKYYFVKLLIDMSIFFSRCLNPVFEADSELVENVYFIKLLSLIIHFYLRNSLFLTSEIMHIAAVSNCYLKLVNVQKVRFKHTFKLIVASAFLFSFLFYIYRFYSVDIAKITKIDSMNNTMLVYRLVKNAFALTDTFSNLEMAHTFFRDFLYVFVLFLINLLIFIRLKKNFKFKKILMNNNENSKLEKTEKSIAIMVIVIGATQTIGHIPNFMIKFKILDQNQCFISFSYIMLYISLISFTVVLYLFNNVIRNSLNMILVMTFKFNKKTSRRVNSI